jgi:hypothetical protein
MGSYGLVQRTNSVTCISLLQLHLATWIHGRRSIYQATQSRHYTGYHGRYLAQRSGSLGAKKFPDRDRDRPGTRSTLSMWGFLRRGLKGLRRRRRRKDQMAVLRRTLARVHTLILVMNLLHTELEIRSRNEDVADVRQAFRAFSMFHVGGGNLASDCVIRNCGRRNKIFVSTLVCDYLGSANAVPQDCQNFD